MTPHDPDPHDEGDRGTADDTLRRLLADAVADVEPPDRLGEIRRRTRRARSSRRWLPVVAGAGVATAAVVGGVIALGQLGHLGQPGADHDDPAAAPDMALVRATAVYYVGDTPTGPRLFREFQSLPVTTDAEATIDQALARLDPAGGAADPDYRTVWPAGSFGGVEVGRDRITVTLADEDALARPPGVDTREAVLGIQQVVYTADAGIARTLPVAFEHDGAPVDEVLGVDVAPLTPRDRQYDVLSPVNVSDPTEGSVVRNGHLLARGTTTESVADVTWTVRPAPGYEPPVDGIGGAVLGGTVTETPSDAQGLGWQARINLRGLPPGRYVLVTNVRSVGQASDQPALFRDTRTFVVP